MYPNISDIDHFEQFYDFSGDKIYYVDDNKQYKYSFVLQINS